MLIHVATDNDLHPPRFGATQRTFGLCRGLARRHDVRALCVVPNRNRGAREEQAEGVRLVRRRAWYTSVAWRLERLGLAPLALAARGHRLDAARLLSALEGAASVFAADFLLTPLFDRHPARFKVYLAQNVEADYFTAAHPAMARSSRWKREIESLEARAADRAALIVVCTAEDGERFRTLYGVGSERLHVAPNGWDERRLHPATPDSRARARAALGFGERETVALFVGSDAPHNRVAANELITGILPPLAGDGFRLVVVGSVARGLSSHRAPWLRLEDEVDDLEPWLHAADIGLNPVTRGGGSNVKLPTYLAAGLAVITTPFGLRGYGELAPWCTVASGEAITEALRARPAGWAARGLAMPAPVAALAWGGIGEALGERLEPRAGIDARHAAEARA
jgi:glycosyltransferase involved in cell wall biosynthesis